MKPKPHIKPAMSKTVRAKLRFILY
jgi:hypothetical protein